ncbi:hypothetical protein [Streptomyces cacaoi]|uniref:hypothetical protein n=1 Tax=Streptomyces cacaoi TaxID=1898 RepID=UPI0036FFF15F
MTNSPGATVDFSPDGAKSSVTATGSSSPASAQGTAGRAVQARGTGRVAAEDRARITVSRKEAGTGGSVTVRGTGWRPRTLLTLLICGQNAIGGTNTCANADGRAVTTGKDGTFRYRLPVAEPPKPCPCVVRATTVTGAYAADEAALRVAGHPVAPLPKQRTPGRLTVLAARLEGESGLLNWFGAPQQRKLVLTVGNLGVDRASDPVFEVGTAHGVLAPDWERQQWRGDVDPGEKQRVELPVELATGAHGEYTVAAKYGDKVLTEQPWDVGRPWGVTLFWVLLCLVVPAVVFRLGMAVVDRARPRVTGPSSASPAPGRPAHGRRTAALPRTLHGLRARVRRGSPAPEGRREDASANGDLSGTGASAGDGDPSGQEKASGNGDLSGQEKASGNGDLSGQEKASGGGDASGQDKASGGGDASAHAARHAAPSSSEDETAVLPPVPDEGDTAPLPATPPAPPARPRATEEAPPRGPAPGDGESGDAEARRPLPWFIPDAPDPAPPRTRSTGVGEPWPRVPRARPTDDPGERGRDEHAPSAGADEDEDGSRENGPYGEGHRARDRRGTGLSE